MRGKHRKLWPMLLAIGMAVAFFWVLYAVGRSREQFRNDIATYLGFALALVVPGAGWIVWIWRQSKKPNDVTTQPSRLEHLADHLAEAVNRQWEEAAQERKLLWPEAVSVRWKMPSEALAGPVTAAVNSMRFPPLPGLRSVQKQDLREGDIARLHAIYGGLGSGRLVITGAPGSGKSGAAILLILAALRYREHAPEGERNMIPVPVMFTLQGWDPSNRSIDEWLAVQLKRTYSMFADKGGAGEAASLLARKKLAVILDGLDEVAEELRPVALRVLSTQANFRVVLVCRTKEMAAAAQEDIFHGAAAVELQQVNARDAARYLADVKRDPPPAGWAELTRRLNEASDTELAQALCSPLALTLVRDTYRDGDDVRKLIDISNSAAPGEVKKQIELHLLDRVIPAAYGLVDGRAKPPYGLEQAEETFRYIASRMSKDSTTDLRWWLIYKWSNDSPRTLITMLVAGLVTAVWVALIYAFVGGGAIGGLILGAIGGMAAALYFGYNAEDNHELAIGPPPGILPFGGGGGGGIKAILHWFEDPSTSATPNPLTPKISWRSAFIRALFFGPILAIFGGLAIGLLLWGVLDETLSLPLLVGSIILGLAVGVAAIPAFALTATPTWTASLTFLVIRFTQHAPLRLMRFFEDARERGVLRTVGPVYQFRHALLQERLAEQSAPPESVDDRT